MSTAKAKENQALRYFLMLDIAVFRKIETYM